MRMKQLAVAIALIGAGVTITAQAEEKVNKVERVEVTGSSIKRIKKESSTAVQVMTKEQIKATGAATVAEVFQKTAGFTSYNDETNASSAPGRSTVAFRQLTSDDVLVLLNGRRMAKNAVNASAYDLNSIPVSAVERIDVLKDGAAAIYGTDAIAGVINIVTKKNYQGGEVTANYGQASEGDGGEKRLAAAFGYGDLEEQGFNLLVTAEKFDRDAIFRRDRAITSRKGTGTFNDAALSFNRIDAKGKTQPIHACKFELVTDDAGTYCPYYFNAEINLIPESHREGLFGMLNIKLGESNTFYIEAMNSKNETTNFFSAPPGTIRDISASNPTNIFKEDITKVRLRMNQNGPRTFVPTLEASRIGAGLDGTFAEVDYKLSLSRNTSKSSELSKGFFDYATLGKDVKAGKFDIFKAIPTKAELEKYFKSSTTDSETIVDAATAQASTVIYDLPAGPLGLAFGLSHNKESLSISPDAFTASVSPTGAEKLPVSSDLANRTVSSAFLELSIPILKELEMQLAVRHDKYSDVGGVTTPKVALRWEPMHNLLLRGSYTEGFRAPNFEDLYQPPIESADSVRDTLYCKQENIAQADCAVKQRDATRFSNSKLKPEKSKSFALGLVYAPNSALTTSLDYYWIKKTDQIDRMMQFIVDNPNAMINGVLASTMVHRSPPAAPGKLGAIDTLDNPLANVAETELSGLEWGVEFKLPKTEWGQITLDNQVSYNLQFDKSEAPGEAAKSWIGLIDRPEFSNAFRVTYNYGDFTLNSFIRTIGGMYDAQNPGDKSADTPRVSSFTTVDLTASYANLFVKGFSVNGGVKNLFNATPTATTADAAAGFPATQSAVGPFYYMGAGYKF